LGIGKGDKIIGSRLKYLRQELLDMSQKEFGLKINVIDSTISKMEKGVSGIDLRILQKLQVLLDVNLNWFVSGVGDPFLINSPNNVINDEQATYSKLNVENIDMINFLKSQLIIKDKIITKLLEK